MSAAEQLSLDAVAPPADRALCRCGHERLHHLRGKGACSCGAGTKFGGCTCAKFRPRARVKVVAKAFERPAAAIDLMRPDTKRKKSMGWALVTDAVVHVWLDGLKTISLNAERNMLMSAARGGKRRVERIGIAISEMHKDQRDRALSALEQAAVLRRADHVPDMIEVTRIVSGPGLDGHDNLRGALKRVVDGIAEALLINDKVFASGKPSLVYAQRAPGKRGVLGVEIRLTWRPS